MKLTMHQLQDLNQNIQVANSLCSPLALDDGSVLLGKLPSAGSPYDPFLEPRLGDCGLKFQMKHGLVHVYENEEDLLLGRVWSKMPNIDLKTFVDDMNTLSSISVHGPL